MHKERNYTSGNQFSFSSRFLWLILVSIEKALLEKKSGKNLYGKINKLPNFSLIIAQKEGLMRSFKNTMYDNNKA
jgi:hypothetical protein